MNLQGATTVEELSARLAAAPLLRRTWFERTVAETFGGRPGDPWGELEALLASRSRGRLVLLLDEVRTWLDAIGRGDRERAALLLAGLHRLRDAEAPDLRLVLTGSVSLRTVASSLGARLDAEWRFMRLGPLEPSDGATLFEHVQAEVCDERSPRHAHDLAGGNPRWIRRLGVDAAADDTGRVTVGAVEVAAERIVRSGAFDLERAHLGRHAENLLLDRALVAAAMPGATPTSVLAALQGPGVDRARAERLFGILVDDGYLTADAAFVLPLLGRAWRR